VRHSLARIREFWKVHGIWPETTPQDEGIHIEYGGRPQPISNRPLALNVGRTSGEHLAARTSLNTGPAQSVGTVVTSATSPTRRSLASRASTSRRRKQRAVFRAPGGAEARS
jgi:hypothetical protein